MMEIIVTLIIFQSLFIALGYFALAREIKSTRRRIALLAGMVSVLPLIFASIGLVANQPITPDSFVSFFYMYIGTVIASSITTGIVEVIEGILLNRRW